MIINFFNKNQRLLLVFFTLLFCFSISNIFATTANYTNTRKLSKKFRLHHTHTKKVVPHKENIWKKIAGNMNLKSYSHNPIVHQYIRWYLVHTKALYELTQNSEPYVAYIVGELKKRGMPLELALLPMVESSYNPTLSSNKGAVGLWQMMPTTARDLGISINWWYDGRRDIVASTHAALDYLQYLHDYFKSWPLTFAAYNSGIGTVQKAIRHNQALGLPVIYRELSLPQQTKEYVPKIVALAMILSDPKQYRLPIHLVSNKQVFTSVKLNYPLPLTKVAKLAKCRLSWIYKLNPGFKRKKPSPERTHYNVLIPTRRVEPFNARLAQYIRAAQTKKIKTHVYQVKKGDSLISIAAKHHITLAALRESNHLFSNLIKAGQALYIQPAFKNTSFRDRGS